VYPDPRVADYLTHALIPVKIHIKEQPGVFERFGVQWTPTLVFFDGRGKEVYRFEGYLPPRDFLAQLELGTAKGAFARNDFGLAEQLFRKIPEEHPQSAAAAEALYWAGVSRYKASGDAGALADTAAEFRKRYRDSDWAKKASVWGG
jgi:thioredoxin-like negative regulator of GroEL